MIDKCVDDMQQIDIIEKRQSQWGSPVCIVAKAKVDGSPRFCVDYRTTINKFLVRETWPMPDIESHIDTVGGANFITVCDVQSAYWQIPTAPKDRHKTAFVTSKGKYVFKVLPFGIANAPWIFQRVMSLAFANFGQPSGLLVYMDDVIACSATWEAHLKLLEDMFRALQTAGLTLKPAKVYFGPKEVQYLGHVLSADGIRMGEDRIKAIVDLKTPTRGSTIGEGMDTTISSSGRYLKQTLPGMGLHDPLHGRQACLEFITFDQGVGQICSRLGLFLCRSFPKEGQICYIPDPPNR